MSVAERRTLKWIIRNTRKDRIWNEKIFIIKKIKIKINKKEEEEEEEEGR